jgi:signal peptidase I
MKKFLGLLKKYLWDSFIGNVIIIILFINFAWQSFIIPSASMEGTLMTGDFVVVNKHSYGINDPVIPFLEWKIIETKTGHLTDFIVPTRGEVLVFRPPMNPHTYYVKRLVAVEGDQLFFKDKKLYINFKVKPSDINFNILEYIKVNNEIFYKEPYKQIHNKIHNIEKVVFKKINNAENISDIDIMKLSPDLQNQLEQYNVLRTISEFPYKTKFEHSTYTSNNISYSIYTVQKGDYFMVGDNRDNSNDSRFWGTIQNKHILGTPSFVWFSIDWDNYSIRFNRIATTKF